MSVQRVYLIHALAPLHVGVDAGVGAIDLPTMREVHTRYPVIPGSSVKGVLREEAEVRRSREAEEVLAVFGPPQNRSGESRGGAVFTDAQLLALPVRSLCGTFAWVTCDFVLRRFDRDLRITGNDGLSLLQPITQPAEARLAKPAANSSGGPALAAEAAGQGRHRVFLEDLLLEAEESPETGTIAESLALWLWPGGDDRAQEFFRERFLVVHDDVFAFLSEIAMEVRARVQLDSESGTVNVGPWSEEHIPAEAVLHGLVMGRKTRILRRRDPGANGEVLAAQEVPWSQDRSLAVVAGLLDSDPVLRFGGHSSVGLGRARVRLLEASRCGDQGGAA